MSSFGALQQLYQLSHLRILLAIGWGREEGLGLPSWSPTQAWLNPDHHTSIGLNLEVSFYNLTYHRWCLSLYNGIKFVDHKGKKIAKKLYGSGQWCGVCMFSVWDTQGLRLQWHDVEDDRSFIEKMLLGFDRMASSHLVFMKRYIFKTKFDNIIKLHLVV